MAEKDRFRLLVVDDDASNRDLLARRLTRLGYMVSEVGDAQQALAFIKREPIDLMLLDVIMPGMDGLELLTTLRQTYSMIDMPVIIVTARDQSGDVVAALNLGANDYLTKPLNFPVAIARIQTHLSLRQPRPAEHPPVIAATQEPRRFIDSGSKDTDPRVGRTLSQQIQPVEVFDKVLIGEYEILGELARGSLGVVYKAKHLGMGRTVALKVVACDELPNPAGLPRFFQEIQAPEREHRHVARIVDIGAAEESFYFATEYLDGLDLARFVKQCGRLRIDQACDYLRQAALGLLHTHRLGLVHHDLKPSNLIVTQMRGLDRPPSGGESTPDELPTPWGVVKILDLGLHLLHQPAETQGAISELTRAGRRASSVDYLAPEQWMNTGNVDIRADLYGLGCTFYFLLTGQPPFPGDEPIEKMLKHHLDQPTPIEQIRPETPENVLAIAQRLLAKRPEDRYQSPEELANLLTWICQANLGAKI